jgi:hypothetical protein
MKTFPFDAGNHLSVAQWYNLALDRLTEVYHSNSKTIRFAIK